MSAPKNSVNLARVSQESRSRLPAALPQVNLKAAGTGVGASSHYAPVPEDCSRQPVREFAACTAESYRLASWLAECRVKTVA